MTSRAECLDLSLVVVDENSIDYQPIINELRQDNVVFYLYSTGEDALRDGHTSTSTVWIVNVRLPDMSGVEFVALINRRLRHCTIFLVGNQYSPEDELAARAAGATGYLCKPATATWLNGCRMPASARAIRAGPAP
jgi:DNA-binding response OmpR family regulator